MKQECPYGGNKCEQEQIGVNICQRFQTHLRCHSHTENQDEKCACFKSTLETPHLGME